MDTVDWLMLRIVVSAIVIALGCFVLGYLTCLWTGKRSGTVVVERRQIKEEAGTSVTSR